MRFDLARLPVGGLLIGFLLASTVVSLLAALLFHQSGMPEGAAGGSATPVGAALDPGQQVAAASGCFSCHSTTGEVIVGPSWKGLFGTEAALADGGTVTVDEAYIRESILTPQAKVVSGFSPVMPSFSMLSDGDIQAIITYIQGLQ